MATAKNDTGSNPERCYTMGYFGLAPSQRRLMTGSYKFTVM